MMVVVGTTIMITNSEKTKIKDTYFVESDDTSSMQIPTLDNEASS